MHWMILPYRRYADFSGRSRRLEYWLFTLFYILVIVGIFVVGGVLGAFDRGGIEGEVEPGNGVAVMLGVLAVFVLGSFIPGLAVQVRRFHDQDKSGWLVLLGFIPYIGGIIVLVFMLLEGTRGENSYGPDPKRPEFDAETFR
jgi:uncharacterized membrane protein YhaH (DUF805 family)